MAITLDGTTGVTAAEFDGTVDASNLTGALPAIDGSALTGIDTSPPTTFDAVGTYVWCHYVGTDISRGASVSSSTLRRSDIQSIFSNDGSDVITTSNSYTFLSGTWRYMGHKVIGQYLSGSNIYSPIALFVRIS